MTENQMEEIKRHFDVVAERIQSEIRVAAKRMGLLRKLDSVRGELKGEIQAVGDKVEGHEERITSLEQKAA